MNVKNIRKKVLAIVLSSTFIIGIMPISSISSHALSTKTVLSAGKTESKEETEEQKKARQEKERQEASNEVIIRNDTDMTQKNVIIPSGRKLDIKVDSPYRGSGYFMVDVSRDACKRISKREPLILKCGNYKTTLLEEYGHYDVSYDSRKDMYRFYIPCDNMQNPELSIEDPNNDGKYIKFDLRVYSGILGKYKMVPAETTSESDLKKNDIEATSRGEDERVYEGFIFGREGSKVIDTFIFRPDANSSSITLNIGAYDEDGFSYDSEKKNHEFIIRYYNTEETYDKIQRDGLYKSNGDEKYDETEYKEERIDVSSSGSVTLPWYPKHGIIEIKLKNPNYFLTRLSVVENGESLNIGGSSTSTGNNSSGNESLGSIDTRARRFSGSDRYDTSIDLSKKAFTKSDVAVVASGKNYADALSGSALAAVNDAPLLLVESGKATDNVEKELERLGVKTVYILGGKNSISNNVESQLSRNKDDSIRRVIRLDGSNRYETSYKVYKEVTKMKDSVEDPIIVSGKNFADALSASSLAARYKRGIVLVDGHNAVAGLDKYNSGNLIVGGFTSVDNTFKGGRFAGKDRYETSVKVAEAFYSTKNVFIASGESYPDGLSSITLYGKYEGPLLLTRKNSLPTSVKKFLIDKDVKDAYIIGGKNSVSDSVEKLFK